MEAKKNIINQIIKPDEPEPFKITSIEPLTDPDIIPEIYNQLPANNINADVIDVYYFLANENNFIFIESLEELHQEITTPASYTIIKDGRTWYARELAYYGLFNINITHDNYFIIDPEIPAIFNITDIDYYKFDYYIKLEITDNILKEIMKHPIIQQVNYQMEILALETDQEINYQLYETVLKQELITIIEDYILNYSTYNSKRDQHELTPEELETINQELPLSIYNYTPEQAITLIIKQILNTETHTQQIQQTLLEQLYYTITEEITL